MTNLHIEKAVRHFGTQDALAEAIGVSQAAVNKWLHGSPMRLENAIRIEQATSGVVRAVDLIPDLQGVEFQKPAA